MPEDLVEDPAGFLYVCPDVLRAVDPVAVLLVVEVLRDTDPDEAGLLDAVEPLPTAARVETVLLVPKDDLVVVAVLRPVEIVPDVDLLVQAMVLLTIVS